MSRHQNMHSRVPALAVTLLSLQPRPECLATLYRRYASMSSHHAFFLPLSRLFSIECPVSMIQQHSDADSSESRRCQVDEPLPCSNNRGRMADAGWANSSIFVTPVWAWLRNKGAQGLCKRKTKQGVVLFSGMLNGEGVTAKHNIQHEFTSLTYIAKVRK